MNGQEKSHSAIVAEKPTNGAGQPAEEPVEPRAGAKGKASQQSTSRTLCRIDASQALARIRQTATSVSPSLPEAGTGCLNWARPDLCGGRPVMDVPTAITFLIPANRRPDRQKSPLIPVRSSKIPY